MDTGASQPIRIKLGFIYSYIFASMLASSGEDQMSNPILRYSNDLSTYFRKTNQKIPCVTPLAENRTIRTHIARVDGP
jgi:hypothetical protein